MKFLLIPLLALFCFAQTAEVHDLTADESADGQRYYSAMKYAEDNYAQWRHKMAAKYLKSEDGDFSKGFKRIVPKQNITTGSVWSMQQNTIPLGGLYAPVIPQ